MSLPDRSSETSGRGKGLAVAGVLLMGLLGFVGGRLSAGEGPLPAGSSPTPVGIPDFVGGGGGEAPVGDPQAGDRAIQGSIVSFQPGLIEVGTTAGRVLVELTDSTVVTRVVVSDPADLDVGDVVTVGADTSATPSTGQIVAATVEVAP